MADVEILYEKCIGASCCRTFGTVVHPPLGVEGLRDQRHRATTVLAGGDSGCAGQAQDIRGVIGSPALASLVSIIPNFKIEPDFTSEGLSLCYTDVCDADKHFLVSRDDPCGDMCIVSFRLVSSLPRCFLRYLLEKHFKKHSERVWRNTQLSVPEDMNVWAVGGLARAHKHDAIVEPEEFDKIDEFNETWEGYPRAWKRLVYRGDIKFPDQE